MKDYSVYKITNKVNGKVYIGSSQNPLQRWRQHKTDAYSLGKKQNYPLYTAIRKYGINNFDFEIIKNGFETRYDMEEYEHDMIIEFNSLVENGHGYNQILETHSGLTDKRIREEAIKKRSQKCAKVDRYDNIIEEYSSYQDADRKNGNMNEASHIRNVCKGISNSYKGEYYRDLDENDNVIHIDFKPLNNKTAVICINIANPQIIKYFNSVSEAAREIPSDRGSIHHCINGNPRHSTVKGYIIRKIDENGNPIENSIPIKDKIAAYNEYYPMINGERHNITEWCKIYGISTNSYYKRRNKGMGVMEAITTPKDENKVR